MINSLSVVIPVYNESKRLKDCFVDISRFNEKSIIKKIEYIFVDDGSVDLTSNKIREFIKHKNENK